MSVRRLPVYLLLDCSESMAGPNIEAVSRGVEKLVTEMRGNPQAIESAYLSVITFAREAKQIMPLTDMLSFQPPKLSVRTGTSYGSALKLLMHCIDKEIVKTTETKKGDYRPLIFLMTDGQPTDDWEKTADDFKVKYTARIANFYAIGVGDDVDTDNLRRISEIVLQMPELNPEAINKLFVWLSASVQTVSTKIPSGAGEDPIDLSELPEGIEVAPESSGPKDPMPRQVFIHARCSKEKKPYLMRFRRNPSEQIYFAAAAHPLEEIEEGDSDLLPSINTSQLSGPPPCPYCNNPAGGMCPSCSTLFCAGPDASQQIQCPRCNAQITLEGSGGGGTIDIQQSAG